MTHRVNRKRIVRSRSHPDGRQVFSNGDTLVPTDAELQAFSDRLVKIEDDEEDEEETSEEPEELEDFDEDSWLNRHFKRRIAAVKNGAADEYLDQIEEVETSEQVLDAIQERRDMPEFGTAYQDDEEQEEESDEDEEESEE